MEKYDKGILNSKQIKSIKEYKRIFEEETKLASDSDFKKNYVLIG